MDSVPQQLDPPLQVIVSTSASVSDNMKLTAVSPTLGSSRKVSLASWQLPVSSLNLKALHSPSVSSDSWHLEAHPSRVLAFPDLFKAVVQLPVERVHD